VPGDGQLDVAVFFVGHFGVKHGLAGAQAQVQRRDVFFRALHRQGHVDDVRRLRAVAIEAQVGKLRRGMGEDAGIDNQATLRGMLRQVLERPLVPEIPDLRRRGGQSEQKNGCAQLHWICLF
jgi:hypothetical protein